MLSKLNSVKKFFNKKSFPAGTKISETSQETLRMWQKIVRNKHKGEGYKDDELFTEPLLLIEWDNAGIQARTANNANHNKEALVASIRSQPGYTPFPTVNVQPDCAFSFDSRANFSFMIAALRANNWSTRINSVPDVGYAYSVYVPKKGELNIVEEPVIFNVLLWVCGY
ncbi:hypothetical protein GLOIN_2v1765488 [Rhizophagus clarus]|uniref:Uncharacterized protein n=1 Tax=Rhizophagus clarus TaxID=94130 RepID=A0A8H3QNJ9_9GLOM|nr:hypothetical protein GLOIN_2v1765488 [Rhizophagus clarus]